MVVKYSNKPTSIPKWLDEVLKREREVESAVRDAAAREVVAQVVAEVGHDGLPISNEKALEVFKRMKEARKQANKEHGVHI